MNTLFLSTCSLLLLTGTVSAVSAADKVVVIPLSSTQQGTVLLGSDILNTQPGDTSEYTLSSQSVMLPADGRCVVTTNGFSAQVDSSDDVSGYYFRTARQAGSSSPEFDEANGMWALMVAGTSTSTGVSATYSWDMTGNTAYNFGCAFLDRATNWGNSYCFCRVSWVCSTN
jgi:hypothetical protein